jgi:hypothetical protein
MPLLKPVEPPEEDTDAHYVSMGLVERAIAYVGPYVGFHLDSAGPKKHPLADVPRIGEYYVDYSGLTPEESDAPEDPAITALFNTSKPVSR